MAQDDVDAEASAGFDLKIRRSQFRWLLINAIKKPGTHWRNHVRFWPVGTELAEERGFLNRLKASLP